MRERAGEEVGSISIFDNAGDEGILHMQSSPRPIISAHATITC